jgi:hypothetical protein
MAHSQSSSAALDEQKQQQINALRESLTNAVRTMPIFFFGCFSDAHSISGFFITSMPLNFLSF